MDQLCSPLLVDTWVDFQAFAGTSNTLTTALNPRNGYLGQRVNVFVILCPPWGCVTSTLFDYLEKCIYVLIVY